MDLTLIRGALQSAVSDCGPYSDKGALRSGVRAVDLMLTGGAQQRVVRDCGPNADKRCPAECSEGLWT